MRTEPAACTPPRALPALALATAWTWEGQPAHPGEVAVLSLTWEGARLRVDVGAPLHGDPPPEAPPGATWALWEHEVVELFLAGPGPDERVAYTELELGPHGHHLLLTLRGRRQITAERLPLEARFWRERDRWGATAWLDPAQLPEGLCRANTCAVHGLGAARRYLSAVPLPGPAPDFHQPQRLRALPPGALRG